MDLGLRRHDIRDNMWNLIKVVYYEEKVCGEV